MRGNRKRDTIPELTLRRALHSMGLRYRVASRPTSQFRWTADVVFPTPKVAVFVDGCFWHGCPEHYAPPRTNMSYWGPKLQRNRERDLRVTADLIGAGWHILRFWEHEDMEQAAREVEKSVRRFGKSRSKSPRPSRGSL